MKKCPICKKEIEEKMPGTYECKCGYKEFTAKQSAIHELKILPKYFKELGISKNFEVRKDDRNFQVGDWLILNEYDDEKKVYTGNYVFSVINYILGRNKDEKLFVPDGYVILGLKIGTPEDNSKFPRPSVMIFANAMEKKLKDNDYKGGWKNCPIEYLANKLDEEIEELLDAVSNGTPSKVLSEAADVGNIAMMIADIYEALQLKYIK
ncbi:MAG: hypothetical protein K0R54_4403 [Clostridiaceae bacterium]|jgi:phosphoribosyl-ATP pyrophosphohydrolase|nr:hypothetical protein [Clostridiaceae bacterium]